MIGLNIIVWALTDTAIHFGFEPLMITDVIFVF